MIGTVLITGVSGYIGTMLCRRFQESPKIEKIIGVDLVTPREAFPKLVFYQRDSIGDLNDIFSERPVDILVHLVFVLDMIHKPARMYQINVGTLDNVLAHADTYGVKRVVVTSSSTAYGAHPDNPVPLTEDAPLRGNQDYQYARDKTLVEERLREYQNAHPGAEVVIARLALVMWPTVNNFIGRYISRPIVPLVNKDVEMKFIHEEDAAEALFLLATQARRGAYNLGPSETVRPAEVIRQNGGRVIQLPAWLLRPLTQMAWTLRLKWLAESPGSMIPFLRYPWIVDGSKAERETGFRCRYTSAQAVQSFLDSRRK